MILQMLKIELLQELLERLIALLDLHKELLGVRPRLGASARAHMQLDSAPLFPVEFQGLQKTEVLIFRPSTLL
jgi:hypothetical protein